jgi:CO/xanthine dehydrogenase Mo-binding subunit
MMPPHLVPVSKKIVTVEGASGPVVDAVRDAWYRGNVVQCGYCQPGQTLAAVSLLESNPAPDNATIAMWMNGNLCRCGTYPRIKQAIGVAAQTLASGLHPAPLTARPEPEIAPLSPADLADPVRPYIQIKPDGTVLVFSSQLEMGQGAHTGLAAIVAEELDADFESIQVVNAANDATPSGDVLFKDGVDFMTVTGVVDNPYAFENFKVEGTNVDAGVPIMVWRSVGNSHTEFARESALDELALAAGRDPVDLRRELLVNNPRTLRALELAAERSGWASPPPAGRARGIACTNYLSASVQVIEVSQDDRKRIHVEHIVFALDCGIVVDPDLVRAQVEGGLLWGLGAAAWGEIVFGAAGDILTQNFDRYPVMRMQSIPLIEVHLIESTETPSGVGEVSVPTVAPALANAIAALTGTRIRRLPMSRTIQIY